MNMKTCPNCGNEISNDAIQCPHCGTILMTLGKTGAKGLSRKRALIGGIVLLLFPLCCLAFAGYRVVNGAPPDIEALLARNQTEATEIIGEVISEVEQVVVDTPLPSMTVQPVTIEPTQFIEPTPGTSSNIPEIPEHPCIPLDTERQVAEVIQVIDGDEIRVRIEGDEFIVRYIGIVAPEITDPFGPEASNENIYLVFSKQVVLVRDVTDRDPEGRLLRYVFVGDLFVNHELIHNGFAEAENMPPDLSCSDLFQEAEAAAQADKAGLWKVTPTLTRTLAPLWTATPDKTSNNKSGGNPNCNCNGPDLDCEDFDSQADAQWCYLKCLINGDGDIFNLDPDGDGEACE